MSMRNFTQTKEEKTMNQSIYARRFHTKSKVVHTRSHFFHSKKGVSPLIATVLLIAFAVALGAVVMNWGRGYVEDTQDFAQQKSDSELRCSSDVKIDFIQSKTKKFVCFSNDTTNNIGNIRFTLSNVGQVDISELQTVVIGTAGVSTKIFNLSNATLTKGAVFRNVTNFSNSVVGGVEQFRIVSGIKVGSKIVACPNNVLEAESISDC